MDLAGDRTVAPGGLRLRHVPSQARSWDRLRRVLDAADELLAAHGAVAFTTSRIAAQAGVPVGSVYRFFDDKEAIVEALALRYWGEFEAVVARLAESPAGAGPVEAVIDALADAFRTRPGFLALWYGGLRTERIRDATRPMRSAITAGVARILGRHWPARPQREIELTAEMVVLTGDGLLREAFRRRRDGDPELLAESKRMISAYLDARLGRPSS